jgi:hypothetical protein
MALGLERVFDWRKKEMRMAKLGQMLKQLQRECTRAQNQVERLDEAIGVFEKLVGTNSRGAARANSKGARKLSAAARRKIGRAQKARWAKLRQKGTAKS